MSNIDLDDMPEITDFSKAIKNPFAKDIRKNGYTITTTKYYSPQDVANGSIDDTKDIVQALVDLMTTNDTKRLLAHIKEKYNLPCSPMVWESIKV